MNTTDRVPLYQQVQEYIRVLIGSEALKEGERIPTEKELMERFNVSKITVVNALSGLAADGVITRVPGRGSFVSNQPQGEVSEKAAASAAPASLPVAGGAAIARKTGTIGIVMPSIDDYFAIRWINGLRGVLGEQGYRSVLLLSDSSLAKEKDAIETLKNIGAEGMVVFPVDGEQYNEEILAMKFAGFPFVLIDRYLPGVETNYIAADGRMGASLAVDHLWELGHREIAICSDSPLQTVTVQERIEGYMNAMKNKGGLVNPAHIITGFSVESLKDADRHPLYRYIRNRMATAYITLNGRLGVQIYQMARQAGLDVPGDLSVVSFDDPTSIVEEFSIFTHVKQFEYDMGRRAAERVLELVRDGGGSGPYTKTLIEPELCIRSTSGPPHR